MYLNMYTYIMYLIQNWSIGYDEIYRIQYSLTIISLLVFNVLSSLQEKPSTTFKFGIEDTGINWKIKQLSQENSLLSVGWKIYNFQSIDCVKEGKDLALIQLEGVWQTRLSKLDQYKRQFYKFPNQLFLMFWFMLFFP